ncbi:hypothetical protein M8C21_011498 [Ambrosia artemisiifolia]|uniref:Uncharacterized protein n=1 Tax=Ambrosia artemisiifolia TaxID=4212 RepID=A0AAD5BXM8_AMBAR|nr:hypothetical protein M8C21_011498 [Ambrosia artemisiifolia]
MCSERVLAVEIIDSIRTRQLYVTKLAACLDVHISHFPAITRVEATIQNQMMMATRSSGRILTYNCYLATTGVKAAFMMQKFEKRILKQISQTHT